MEKARIVNGRAPMADTTRDLDEAKSARERIPGEHDADTLMSRQPGAMGGRPSGADTPSPDPHDLMDDATIHDRKIEGGGGE